MSAEVAALQPRHLDPAHEAVVVNILEGARAEAGRHQGMARLLVASVADLAVFLLHVNLFLGLVQLGYLG